MKELGERRWAVMSERGCEATGMDYLEAARLVGRLKGEKLSGLCIITDEAARRLQPAAAERKNGEAPDTMAPAGSTTTR